MQSEPYDIAVIGAGVVGCAIARRFTLDGARVVVLEKALDVLDGASKGNSAILHTGFDVAQGSLEFQCIASGYTEYLSIADELSLPVLKSGAMVIAWDEEQLNKLPALIENAQNNGITDVAMLSCKEIKQREPHLSDRFLGGLEIPGEYLIDPWYSAHAYILQALSNGAELRRGTEVQNGVFEGNRWRLFTNSDEICANRVLNCAGLYGDVVDEMLIGKRNFKITPRKGQFIVFDKAASNLVSAIIMSVPVGTTKGIVICRTIFGNVLVGPTAEEQQSRVDVSTDRENLTALREKGISMLPGLEVSEVTATYAGLRPASEFNDYQISFHDDISYISIGAIRSTGLSSALGIARHVANHLEEQGLKTEPLSNPAVPVADRLSNYHDRDWQMEGCDRIVCHCELVTRREINRVLEGSMPPATLSGLKRRTRVTMGVCQGFYCTAELAQIARERFKTPVG